jgi:hypothetical protein
MSINWKILSVNIAVGGSAIIQEVAWNKSILLLKIILQNTQTLQQFTKIIKTENYLQKLLKYQAGWLRFRDQVV